MPVEDLPIPGVTPANWGGQENDAITTRGNPVSTDGSFGLPVPTGIGLEFIITASVLEDIQMDGMSL